MAKNANKSIDFRIKKFDMNMVGDNKVILFIGKRGTGKSTLVIDYLFHNQHLVWVLNRFLDYHIIVPFFPLFLE